MANEKKQAAPANGPIEVRVKGSAAYRICPEESFENLPSCMKELGSGEARICVVTDSNVEKLYLQEVLDSLRGSCRQLSSYTIPAGEAHKNLDEIRSLYLHLISQELDRRDILIALGGGVTGDMTGFAAATYLRGIRFVQVPTTLLSQVDSSIGGKTGVDLQSYKNMVGAFHQPSLVYLNINTLKTLDETQFASGMGEVLKHGLIKDAAYYEWCLDHMGEIEERDTSVLKEMVIRSILIKRAVVQKDPMEKGERALLNFGHTAGHSIEKLMDFRLSHGECVNLGVVAASYISWKKGNISEEIFYEIRDMSVGFDLPITYDTLKPEAILETMKKDKKRIGGKNRLILLKKLGSAYIDEDVTDEEILDALRFIRYEES
jgi:3-dehydroquinate synthase